MFSNEKIENHVKEQFPVGPPLCFLPVSQFDSWVSWRLGAKSQGFARSRIVVGCFEGSVSRLSYS